MFLSMFLQLRSPTGVLEEERGGGGGGGGQQASCLVAKWRRGGQ